MADVLKFPRKLEDSYTIEVRNQWARLMKAAGLIADAPDSPEKIDLIGRIRDHRDYLIKIAEGLPDMPEGIEKDALVIRLLAELKSGIFTEEDW